MNCDECSNYEYDEQTDMYYCIVDMDEDDYARVMQGGRTQCPYYRTDTEYDVVRHQM